LEEKINALYYLYTTDMLLMYTRPPQAQKHGWVQTYSIPKFVAEVILDYLPF